MAQRAASSSQGRLNRRFLLVAILLAGLSAALVYARITATDDGSSGGSAAAGDQRVVVARVAIKQRTTITSDMLEIKNLAGNSITAGAFTSVEEAVGKVTKFPIEINQQVVTTSVVDTSRPVTDAAIAYVVPTGKRAVSIRASQVQTAGGLILPGDWIDIVWTCCSDQEVISKTLLKNVQVAAVAQTIISSGPVTSTTPNAAAGASDGVPIAADQAAIVPDAATISLLLSPEEVQQILLAEGRGQLRATSRGIGDTAIQASVNTLITDILPESDVALLPEELKPEGYKRTP